MRSVTFVEFVTCLSSDDSRIRPWNNPRLGGITNFKPPDILELIIMTKDPWSRPSLKDLQQVLESIDRNEFQDVREAERLELTVPAEISTRRGNTISAMTREISRAGIGLLHRGSVQSGEVTVRMASETREFEYRVLIEWCEPCENGMFISGGRFLKKAIEAG